MNRLLLNCFHVRLMAMWEFGLLDHWVDVAFHIPGAEKCFVKEIPTRKAAIKLVDLTGAFLILGIGHGLATLCFLIERIVFIYKREMADLKRLDAIIASDKLRATQNINLLAAVIVIKMNEPIEKKPEEKTVEIEDSLEVVEIE